MKKIMVILLMITMVFMSSLTAFAANKGNGDTLQDKQRLQDKTCVITASSNCDLDCLLEMLKTKDMLKVQDMLKLQDMLKIHDELNEQDMLRIRDRIRLMDLLIVQDQLRLQDRMKLHDGPC